MLNKNSVVVWLLCAIVIVIVLGAGWSSNVAVGSNYRASTVVTHGAGASSTNSFAPALGAVYALNFTSDQGRRPKWAFISAIAGGGASDTVTVYAADIAVLGDSAKALGPAVAGFWTWDFGGVGQGITRVRIGSASGATGTSVYNISWTD